MATDSFTRQFIHRLFLHRWLLFTSLAVAGAAHAEVGLNGSGTLLNGNIEITADLGETRGGNLFHSFSVFNVLTNESVNFSGPNTIHNVISRVTGGTASAIDGPVSLTIPGANFYFINPNGVVFGESGSINATGSVYLGTADVVRFADGSSFYADPATTSVLTTADPVAFGFLSADSAPIELNGTFLDAPVPEGKTFALVAGDIDLNGAYIKASGATVNLASVASAGEAGLDAGAVDVSGFPTLGQIRLSNVAIVDVGDSGLDEDYNFVGFVNNGDSGSIYIRAGQFSLSSSYLVAQTGGDIDSGVIDVAVRGDLVAETDPAIGFVSQILAGNEGGVGAGPGVNLDVGGTLRLSDGSSVISESWGPGAAGDIHIHAGGIEVRSAAGEFTGIRAENHWDAAGASVTIDVGRLQILNDGAFVGTTNDGEGTSGALSIVADSVVATGTGAKTLSLSTETTGGDAGKLTLDTRTLDLRDGARVSSTTAGFGGAGEISIVASDRITVSGESSGIFSQTIVPDAGNAGALSISTPLLQVDGGLVDSITVGAGDAGPVSVHVGNLQLTGGAQIRSFSGGFNPTTGALVAGSGAAGSVSVDATGSVMVSGSGFGRPSGLLAETRGAGAGGKVSVSAGSLTLSDGATISSSSLGDGDAGAVTVRDVVDLQLTGGAQIRSFSGGFNPVTGELVAGSGAAGTVSVDAPTGNVTASGVDASGFPSGLLAETRGAGAGGDVNVSAWSLALSDGAAISSSSRLDSDLAGAAGAVEIILGDSLNLRGASIATQATRSDGGNIIITAPRLIHLVDSQITTSVGKGQGGGGNVNIDPQFVVLQNSQIIANAFGGPGGNIHIVADQLITDPATVISASSALGIDGTVNIEAPDSDVSADLAVLPASFLDAARLMQANCGAARAGLSSLVEVGRGGLPSTPDGYLASLDLDTTVLAGGTGSARRGQSAGAMADLSTPIMLAFAAGPECRR